MAVSCDHVPIHPLPPTGQETAIDRGLEAFAPRANGQHICTPADYRTAEAYLRRCQRRVSRRQKGSRRHRKAVMLLAKAHQHSARQRRDFHHQRRDFHHQAATSTTRPRNHQAARPPGRATTRQRDHQAARTLVQPYDTISYADLYEDLRVRNMVQNHHRAKRSSDAGWSAFLIIRTFKAANAGKRAQAVNPAFTSQACSGPECGVSLHRDHNAALNILRLGHEQ